MLRDRLQKFIKLEHDNPAQIGAIVTTNFAPSKWGIVDGEVVEAIGARETPGMSFTILCSDPITGITVPVPLNECPLFSTPGAAMAALKNGKYGLQAVNQ